MVETRSLRAYADVHLGRQRSPVNDSGPHMTRYLRAANVKDGRLDLSDVKTMNFEPAEQRTFALNCGDVLVTEGSGSLGAVGASSVWNAELAGTVCFQNTLLRLSPRPSTDPKFLAWWCRHAFADGLFASIATGANIYHLSAQRVRALPMTYVPLAEQRAIANYLDAETARIDALIAMKQQLIHLLQERWRSAVTRVVAPSGSLIDPPGDASWPSAAFGAVVRVAEGQVDPRVEPWASMPLLAPNHIESRTGRLRELETARDQGAISGKYVCRPQDVVYSKIRPALAKAAIATGDRLCSADMYPLRVEPQLLPEFLLLVILSPPFTDLAVLESERVAMPKINRDALARVRMPVPPLEKQRQAVAWIAEITTSRDEVTSAMRTQLDLLAERRQALITAAVTGEFTVPGAT